MGYIESVLARYRGFAMRSCMIAFGLLAVLAGAAGAQAGAVGLFKDPAGTICSLEDRSPGIVPFYVVHIGTGGATACQYAAPKPNCLAATFLSDTNMFPVTIGNSQSGVSIGYGTCRSGSIHVQTISYFTQGLTPACCRYYVIPDPNAVSGTIDTVDCNSTIVAASTIRTVINATTACPCGEPTAEESTWGQVKTLYDED
jgi:hypothetical protein